MATTSGTINIPILEILELVCDMYFLVFVPVQVWIVVELVTEIRSLRGV
jgi:hypothetical protein